MIGHHVILVYNWERVQRIAIIKLFLFPPYFCEHIFSACISTRQENRNRTEAKHCLILKINNTYPWTEEQTKKKAFPCQWRDTFTITMYFCYLLYHREQRQPEPPPGCPWQDSIRRVWGADDRMERGRWWCPNPSCPQHFRETWTDSGAPPLLLQMERPPAPRRSELGCLHGSASSSHPAPRPEQSHTSRHLAHHLHPTNCHSPSRHSSIFGAWGDRTQLHSSFHSPGLTPFPTWIPFLAQHRIRARDVRNDPQGSGRSRTPCTLKKQLTV